MNKVYISIFLLFSAINTSGQSFSKGISPALESQYFGENPPGLTPKLFDPKIVSPEGSFEGGIFTPDMREFYFTRKNGKYKNRTFFVIRYENNRWGQESETKIRWPQFSADGNIMYVGKQYMKRTQSGWSKPKSIGSFLKDQAHGKTKSSNETFYFAVYTKDSGINGALYYSRFKNGKYETPIRMNNDINTGTYIAHPYVAPDESYLMWDVVREDGFGQTDIYISFNNDDGTWSKPINMGPQINTDFQESSPWVTYDGKYLFFTRGKWEEKKDGSRNYVGKRYWVDAKMIENLRPKQ